MLTLNSNTFEEDLLKTTKEKLMAFLNEHKEECDNIYFDATNSLIFDKYDEVKDKNIINQLFLQSSIFILTANSFETNILHLNAIQNKKQKIKHFIIDLSNNPRHPLKINAYSLKIGKYNIIHLVAKQTGSYSMGGSADLVRFVLRNDYCYPSVFISFGICFGNNIDDNEIGDTIIVEKIYPYFMSSKVKEDYYFVKDTNIFEIDSQLDADIHYLIGKGELKESNGIFYGNMVTGEAVISNEIMKKIFIEAATNQPVLGGEMEGYGLFKECQGYECSIPCLIIKSICDWGSYKNIDNHSDVDDNLKDKLQAYASDKAFKALSIILNCNKQILDVSLYEKIKQKINKKKHEKVLNIEYILELIEEYNTPKKIQNKKQLCNYIIVGLIKEKIIRRTHNPEIFIMEN